MSQQVVVTTNSNTEFKPLVKAAIENEKKALRHGIARTKKHIAELEKKYGMSSIKFEEKYRAGEIEEDLELADWLMEITALEILQEQVQALSDARLD